MSEELNQEQGLSISDLIFLVKKNIIVILIITSICTILGGIYGLGFKKTKYTAVSTAMVEMPTEGPLSPSNVSASLYLINSFKDFIKSQPVLIATLDELKDEYPTLTIESLSKASSVSTSTNSLIITITAVTSNPELSKDIANVLLEKAIECANQKDPYTNEVKYETLNHALKEIEEAQKTIGKRGASTVIIVSFLSGIVLSFAFVFIKCLFDDTYTSKDEFEKTYNINIISSIQEPEGVK